MVKARMISPQELFDASKQHMLARAEPVSEMDWQRLVNFWAANVQRDCAPAICGLMATIFDCPLSETAVKEIAEYQAARQKPVSSGSLAGIGIQAWGGGDG